MNFFSVLAQILLTMMGYSLGALISGKGKTVTPSLLDVAVLAALLGFAFSVPLNLGVWLEKIIGLASGITSGLLITRIRKKGFPDADKVDETFSASRLKRIQIGMRAFGMRMGNYISRLMLSVFYLVLIGPFAIITRLFRNPFKIKGKRGAAMWQKRNKTDSDIQSLLSQF